MNKSRTMLKVNISSGVVVFLIALPLCLGIALASGAPPLAGVTAGVIGGIVVGSLSTSHVSVSGPAAGLTAIIFVAIRELGSFELFLCAGIIAGFMQLGLGFFRAGSIVEYIPIAVIEGMLAGIGVIIILQQCPVLFGQSESISRLPEWITHIHWGAVCVAIQSMLILILWQVVPIVGKMKLLPSALIAVISSASLNQLFIFCGSTLAIPETQLVHLPVPKHLSELNILMTFPDWHGFGLLNVWEVGVTIAIVASIETLLSIEASDRLDAHRRITDTNHELRAQGVGNICSAAIGGLPITSVIVRSSANVTAGATNKLSSIVHGILMLVCVISIPTLLDKIPLASLAVVLIFVGYNLAKPELFKRFWYKGAYQFIPFISTLLAVVYLNLLEGVGVGIAISIFFILEKSMKRSYYLSREELKNADEVRLELTQEVSFLNKAAIKKTLKNIPANSKLSIDARNTHYISHDVLELIEDFVNYTAVEENITVCLLGFKSHYDVEDSSHVYVHHHQPL